ncbi:winged helix-turn-helix domain-containing protein [Streptomyces californicus]|uniref:helix-turn-helix domain-containing protein n=1 Tax=Streptomyces californicus TaxID=67351 RepID=UPI0036B8A32A
MRRSEKQFGQMEAEPAKGPAAHGWEDQRWALSRVRTVIGRRFHLTCTIQGVRKLLVRNGWSCQVPARRAMERDDGAVAGWAREVWPCAEDSPR